MEDIGWNLDKNIIENMKEIGYWPKWQVMSKAQYDYHISNGYTPPDIIVHSEQEKKKIVNEYFQDILGDLDEKQKSSILKYISTSQVLYSWNGWANCRICDEHLGTHCMVTKDRKWKFPEKYEHYILKHNIVPTQDFINDAIKNV